MSGSGEIDFGKFESVLYAVIRGEDAVFIVWHMTLNEIKERGIVPDEKFLYLWRGGQWKEVTRIMASCRDRHLFTAMAWVLFTEGSLHSSWVLRRLPRTLQVYTRVLGELIEQKEHRWETRMKNFSQAQQQWIRQTLEEYFPPYRSKNS